MKNMFAKVICGSRGVNGAPELFTLHLRYPRIIHGEVMTHRDFSRNGRSSRAVPVMKMLKEVWKEPFIPWHWGANKKGMQAGEEIKGFKRQLCIFSWWLASRFACFFAFVLLVLGVHKQIPNRILEPFSYIDVLLSSTKWDNFYKLRIHKDAEPHFHDLARMMKKAIENYRQDGLVQELGYDEWHTPYIQDGDHEKILAYFHEKKDATHTPTKKQIQDIKIKLSVARCARISYTPFNGNASIESELKRYALLVGSSPIHASPAEHQATPTISLETNKSGNFDFGWLQYRKVIEENV